MTQFKRQLLSVIATGSLALNTLVTPVAAATTIQISGNGSQTDNAAAVSLNNETTVVQSNDANVTNNVSANSSTGGNDANDNTGGDVLVWTGDATSDVAVSNLLNSNTAKVDCCPSGDTEILIKENGSYSDNAVAFEQETKTELYQDNDAHVQNDVDADAKTGYNDANRNTGGDVTLKTGDATAKADVSTTANVNSAQIGGSGAGEGGDLSAIIIGNGSYTDNAIALALNRLSAIVQDNDAYIDNDVDADAKTGDNDTNDNTGGEVYLRSGDAKIDVEVDNMVNFNAADIDCGCLLDVLVKIADNGYNSDNALEAELNNEQAIFQGGEEGAGNDAYLDNDVDGEAKTGYNDAERNTGDEHGGDPTLITGDADSVVDVENSGNVNVVGDAGFDFPDFPGVDFSFNLSVTLAQLQAMLGL